MIEVIMVEGMSVHVQNVAFWQVTAEGALILHDAERALLAVFAPGRWERLEAKG